MTAACDCITQVLGLIHTDERLYYTVNAVPALIYAESNRRVHNLWSSPQTLRWVKLIHCFYVRQKEGGADHDSLHAARHAPSLPHTAAVLWPPIPFFCHGNAQLTRLPRHRTLSLSFHFLSIGYLDCSRVSQLLRFSSCPSVLLRGI